MLNEDPKVKVILLNCFGGALNVDKIAGGLTLLFKHNIFEKPIVARMKGNGQELAQTILSKINYPKLHLVDDFDQAVRLACLLAENKSI